MSFSIFYLIPISFAVLLSNFKIGMIISILSAITWLLADIYSGHIYSNFLIPLWNSIMRFGYFTLHSYFLSRLMILSNKYKIDSLIDPLTEVYNNRLFYELLQREANKAKRTKMPLTIAYFDLDNFKSVNDNYGHFMGDVLLRNVASIVKGTIRSSDIIARIGGDEFILLFPETDFESSSVLISRINEKLKQKMKEKNLSVTISIGAITYIVLDENIEEMIKNVDSLMYKAKNEGKNRIEHIIRK